MAAHVMIDIETLGIVPGSAILEIGATRFHPERGVMPGHQFQRHVDLASCQRVGLTVDAETLKWHARQGTDLFPEGAVILPLALRDLFDWLRSIVVELIEETKVLVWAKPPQFDCVLLEQAYRAVGMPIPWRHRDLRDARTIIELAQVDVEEVFKSMPGLRPHSAMDDAIVQATSVCWALSVLGVKA